MKLHLCRWAVTILLAAAVMHIAGCAPAGTSTLSTPRATLAPATATSTSTPAQARTPSPTRSPSPTPSATRPPSPTPSATRPPTLTPTPTPTVAIFELVLTEAELNRLLQDALAKQPNVPASDVSVRLQPGLMVIGGKAKVGFFTLDIELWAAIAVEDGRPVPEIVDIRAGGQPLTGFLRDSVVNMISPYLEPWLQAGTDIYVEEVEITEERLRISGRYK